MPRVFRNRPLYVPYQGPGDSGIQFTAFWGLRAFSLAKIGTEAVILRRDSDNQIRGFKTQYPSGLLDQTEISNFKGAANLTVAAFIDQTGNGYNVTPPDQTFERPFTLNIINGMGTYDNTAGVGTKYTTPITATQADINSHSFYGVYKTTDIHLFQMIVGVLVDEVSLVANGAGFPAPVHNVVVKNEGTGRPDDAIILDAPDFTWHAAVGVINQTTAQNSGIPSSFIMSDNYTNVDTHDLAGNPGASEFGITTWGEDGNGPNTNPLIGYALESGWLSTPPPASPWTQGQAAALIKNARSFWGI